MKTFKFAVLAAVLVLCMVPVLAFADAAQSGNTSSIDQSATGDIAAVAQNSAVSDSVITQSGDSGVAIVAQDENAAGNITADTVAGDGSGIAALSVQ